MVAFGLFEEFVPFGFLGVFLRGPFEEFVPFGLLEEFGWLLVLLREFGSLLVFLEEFVPFLVFLRLFGPFESLFGFLVLFGPFEEFVPFGLLEEFGLLWSFWGVCSFWSFGKSLVLLVFCVWVCSRTFFCFLYITWAATIGRDEIDTIEAKVINILFIFFI
nr:hypothetical protein [Mycoplasmopsis bovis]